MRVLNKRVSGLPDGAVYIGRPSIYGNPYVVGVHGTREEVVELFRKGAKHRFTRRELEFLRGKDLVCWCAPLACHGDVLVEMVREL